MVFSGRDGSRCLLIILAGLYSQMLSSLKGSDSQNLLLIFSISIGEFGQRIKLRVMFWATVRKPRRV
jgi:uncharacterized membrane protein